MIPDAHCHVTLRISPLPLLSNSTTEHVSCASSDEVDFDRALYCSSHVKVCQKKDESRRFPLRFVFAAINAVASLAAEEVSSHSLLPG